MIEILYLHDLYEIYPQYIPEMHWCCMRLGQQYKPPIKMIVAIAVGLAQKNQKSINGFWVESLYHVLKNTIEVRKRYELANCPF